MASKIIDKPGWIITLVTSLSCKLHSRSPRPSGLVDVQSRQGKHIARFWPKKRAKTRKKSFGLIRIWSMTKARRCNNALKTHLNSQESGQWQHAHAISCNDMQWTDMNRRSLHKNIQQTQPASTLGPLGVQWAHVDMDMIWTEYWSLIRSWYWCGCWSGNHMLLSIFKLIIDSTGVFLWSSEIAWAISLSLAISYSWLVLYCKVQEEGCRNKNERKKDTEAKPNEESRM